MKVAVFTSKFPLLSETFIINQIVGLLDNNVDVDIIANETPMSRVMHSTVSDKSLLERLSTVGLNTQKSKVNRIKTTIINLAILSFGGFFRQVCNIIFDRYLKTSQKMNLLSALRVLGYKNHIKRYDNIICHFGINGYYVCKMRDLGIIEGPISTVFHGYEVSHYRVSTQFLKQYKQLFKKGELMLPISELWARQLQAWGCDSHKIKVHRMGIDVNDFRLRDISNPLSTPLKVVQVGRLTEKKAILNSINAVAIASKSKAIDFTVIGDGELYEQAKELVSLLGAEKYINLLGQQPQSVVKKCLDESDVFLLPSVRAKSGDMEGIPVSLMEAMAKGLIAVSTVHSGIPELIENQVSGFLVQENDIEGLAQSLIDIHSLSQKEIESIRTFARQTCEDKFNNCHLNSDLRYLI
ncbi:glycosyltransferase [Vibrio crassostreae]|uniref:glycosyltransferase n=1 Tax=Vibrio crassostreae TaxID=246167 RepID=UPI000F4795A7|nr:glycosyltransferase [Vibrio crassostreae]ROS65582.1 colanic acid/amylovoran biosynthesis glycosyltransferase [Vibrio crassostreae]RPF12603.1 colanic acid/amylovoran biosynthesis glycosyltransferase [Vibrio crassostreae]TCT39782.1 colanic acid/amylovoran biosynthesis glycosyltransferase [Vibrio crassostreae]TCV60206.1 colanic acid/amylovoran biosynthesis glycosyltransferase [Vibrio crassostreae]